MESWKTFLKWRRPFCLNRFRFWPTMVFLVLAIILLQILHIGLLSRLEVKAGETKQVPVGRQLKGRLLSNIISDMEDRVKTSFRLDKSGTYHLMDNFLASEHVAIGKKSSVSLVTQCSSDHLHNIIELSNRWNGPISVSVFTFDDDFINTVSRLIHFHFCYNHIFRHVSFHLAFPISRAPKHFLDMANIKLECADKDSLLKSSTLSLNYNRKDIDYPVNLLRNLAINYVQTPYIFLVDIDLLPSSDLRSDFLNFLSKRASSLSNDTSDKLEAFVVPIFEINSSSVLHIPKNKAELLREWSNGNVRPFYWEVCEKCHRQTDYQAWRLLGSTGPVRIGYKVKRADPWEPFYIAKTSIPLYDERFKQYGFNRISQSCEMHVAGYRFYVLDNAFLVHKGFKVKGNFHSEKDKENNRNRKLYRLFKEELKTRYPGVSRRCY